jgi:hypothetical protein
MHHPAHVREEIIVQSPPGKGVVHQVTSTEIQSPGRTVVIHETIMTPTKKPEKPKMSMRAQLKNFLVNGGDSSAFEKNLYELFGYLDQDEKGYFTKEDLNKFLGFEGPIADDIWSYFAEIPENSEEQIDFLKFKKGLKLLKNNQKPLRGISREVSAKKLQRKSKK